MTPLLIAAALIAAQPAGAAAPDPTPAEAGFPAGAPHGDYPFVAWCYGALRGYLDLHDQVMPEVTRIESTYRRPGSKLADDLKVYADMQRDGHAELRGFQAAMTAAEQASLHPINVEGAAAVQKGRSIWTAGPEVTKARMAQEWMSWTLPARCGTTAAHLKQNAALMGPAFKVNAEPETPPSPPVAPAAPEAPPTDTPAPPPAH